VFYLTSLFVQWSDGQAVIVVPPDTGFHPGIGGQAGKRRRRKLVVEIDGQEYTVATEREAVQVLRQARDRVRQEVKAQVAAIAQGAEQPTQAYLPPQQPHVIVHGDDELFSVVQPQLERFRREIEAVFVQANLRMQEALAEQDDEDIFLLL
jgi:hypothetical protein